MLTSTAAWWNNERDFEHEGDDEYPLRDPHESMVDRRSRYIKQVVDAHHVDDKAATGALRHIYNHVSGGALFTSPTDHGFASNADQARHYDLGTTRKLMDPKTWEGRKPENIDLRQPIHATQNFIRPDSVAHNLFHPGHQEPTEDSAVGDPDYHPDWDDEGRAEMESGSEETPEQKALGNEARFMRRHNGRLEVVDGHHRVAADMLLGKTHTRGVMIHERDLDGVRHHGYVTANAHPTQESLENIKKNFRFADADSWDDAKANFDMDHPSMKSFVNNVRTRGIEKPVRIDYDQSPPEVVDGHQRLVAADAAGLTHVPVKHGTFADVHYYDQ